ncbi:hypothetical protein [Nostoc sp.]
MSPLQPNGTAYKWQIPVKERNTKVARVIRSTVLFATKEAIAPNLD